MMSFDEYLLDEQRGYPTWVKGSSLVIVGKIRSLTIQIQKESDLGKKLDLLAQQNSLISFMVAGGLVASKTNTKR